MISSTYQGTLPMLDSWQAPHSFEYELEAQASGSLSSSSTCLLRELVLPKF
jgi:hypothetical protein